MFISTRLHFVFNVIYQPYTLAHKQKLLHYAALYIEILQAGVLHWFHGLYGLYPITHPHISSQSPT